MAKSTAWSLRGVSRNARNAARESAKSEGVTLGIWLGKLIREFAGAEGISIAPVRVETAIPEQIIPQQVVAAILPQAIIQPEPRQRPARTSSIERAMMKMPAGNSEVTTG